MKVVYGKYFRVSVIVRKYANAYSSALAALKAHWEA